MVDCCGCATRPPELHLLPIGKRDHRWVVCSTRANARIDPFFTPYPKVRSHYDADSELNPHTPPSLPIPFVESRRVLEI